jgi:hypothetical protein
MNSKVNLLIVKNPTKVSSRMRGCVCVYRSHGVFVFKGYISNLR